MKTIIIILFFFVAIGCEKEKQPEPVPQALNVVFYASGEGFQILSPDFGPFDIAVDALRYPDCNSYSFNAKYRIIYLKPGKYTVNIYKYTRWGVSADYKFISFTVKNGCNVFDVSNYYGWK